MPRDSDFTNECPHCGGWYDRFHDCPVLKKQAREKLELQHKAQAAKLKKKLTMRLKAMKLPQLRAFCKLNGVSVRAISSPVPTVIAIATVIVKAVKTCIKSRPCRRAAEEAFHFVYDEYREREREKRVREIQEINDNLDLIEIAMRTA